MRSTNNNKFGQLCAISCWARDVTSKTQTLPQSGDNVGPTLTRHWVNVLGPVFRASANITRDYDKLGRHRSSKPALGQRFQLAEQNDLEV